MIVKMKSFKHSVAKVVISRTFVAILTGATYALPAYAQNPSITLNNPSDVVKMICSVASAMFWILIAVSVVMVLYGAFLYLTGGSDPEKVKNAHKTITYAAVGVVVALIAKGFPSLIASVFSVGGLPSGC